MDVRPAHGNHCRPLRWLIALKLGLDNGYGSLASRDLTDELRTWSSGLEMDGRVHG